MQNDNSLLIDAARDASKFLYRDYCELENLQVSSKNTKIFVEKAKERVKENLQKNLCKYYRNIIFDSLENTDVNNITDPIILVDALDGASNFERAIPFFAVVITILNKKHDKIFTEKMVMNFPALGYIYYANYGRGAWLEKVSSHFSGGAFRLRVSQNNKIDTSVISCNNSQISLAQKISPNIRMFESYAYQAALLVSGKLDCILFEGNTISAQGIALLIKESGGLSFLQDSMFVGSNYQLNKNITNLLKS